MNRSFSHMIEDITQMHIKHFIRLVGYIQQCRIFIENDERMSPIRWTLHNPIIVQCFHYNFASIRQIRILYIQITKQIHNLARNRSLFVVQLLIDMNGAIVLAIQFVEK